MPLKYISEGNLQEVLRGNVRFLNSKKEYCMEEKKHFFSFALKGEPEKIH